MWAVGKTPKYAPSGRVEREDIVGGLHGVHHAIHHQRSGFEFFERFGLKNPLQFELGYILRRDLGEGAVPLAEGGSRVSKPVLRFLGSVQDAVKRDRVLLRLERADGEKDQEKDEPSICLHFVRAAEPSYRPPRPECK